MTLNVIHVNKNIIAMNAKDGGNRPPICVRKGYYGKAVYTHAVVIHGPCRVLNGGQLKCGARVWIEADCDVEVQSPTTYKDAIKTDTA